MAGFVIPLELVLHLVSEDNSALLTDLGHRGVQIQCISTLERGVTCFSLHAQHGDRQVHTGTHPWISQPLVDELRTLLGSLPASVRPPVWPSA